MEGVGCEIFAEVIIEAYMTVPITGTFICAGTATFPLTTAVSPAVCSGISAVTPAAVVLNSSPALQEISKMGMANGCQLVVDFTKNQMKIMVVKSEANLKKSRLEMAKAKKIFRARDTAAGAAWIMQVMRFGR
ncbi:hypothetical protein GH721_08920 [Kriegella sp. EG-1]|nr:hypothetical protein [Flavobacteriaceae bacterium EG-1]